MINNIDLTQLDFAKGNGLLPAIIQDADTGKGVHAGRMTDMMRSGTLYEELGIEPLNPETCRVMICGSMAMLKDCANLCEEAGLAEGSNSEPGQYVIERAFVG